MPPLQGEAPSPVARDRPAGETPANAQAGAPPDGRDRHPGHITESLRRLERAVGAQPGRSLWIWSIPVITMLVTFTLVMIAHPGDLGLLPRLPVALLGSLFMGGMSLTCLLSSDEQEP
ncbi:MAG: hypothetical protein ABR564_06110 [Candidatus Dormibacteria bacterium]